MTLQGISRRIRLSPEESVLLGLMSREDHLSETVLLHKLVSESLARRRLDWACAAYGRCEIDVRGSALYSGLSLYEMLDELKRRGIEIASSEQFLDGLNDLADLFDLPELRAAAAAVTAERA